MKIGRGVVISGWREPPRAPEPLQHGERRIVVRRAGGTLPLVMLAFRAPRATDPMSPALTALGVTLAGTSGVLDLDGSRSVRADPELLGQLRVAEGVRAVHVTMGTRPWATP